VSPAPLSRLCTPLSRPETGSRLPWSGEPVSTLSVALGADFLRSPVTGSLLPSPARSRNRTGPVVPAPLALRTGRGIRSHRLPVPGSVLPSPGPVTRFPSPGTGSGSGALSVALRSTLRSPLLERRSSRGRHSCYRPWFNPLRLSGLGSVRPVPVPSPWSLSLFPLPLLPVVKSAIPVKFLRARPRARARRRAKSGHCVKFFRAARRAPQVRHFG